jgi:hypothetical protein
MTFHNRKLYKDAFAPKAFCYAIRRPDHYPEGSISLETRLSDGESPEEPLRTHVRKLSGSNVRPMHFELNAATNVTFNGDRYLHAYVGHSFKWRVSIALHCFFLAFKKLTDSFAFFLNDFIFM